jgi:hypothetical protein
LEAVLSPQIDAFAGKDSRLPDVRVGSKAVRFQTEQMFSGLHLKADARRLRVQALIDRERAAALPLVALPHLAAYRPDGMFHANPKSMKSD